MQQLVNITLLVKDYDEAIAFYVGKLNFTLVEDTVMSPEKRWVRVQPPGQSGCCLLLAKATNENQQAAVGKQTGGRVFLFIHTHDFDRDYALLVKHQIEIVKPIREEEYGKVCVFADLYGNLIDLIEPIVL